MGGYPLFLDYMLNFLQMLELKFLHFLQTQKVQVLGRRKRGDGGRVPSREISGGRPPRKLGYFSTYLFIDTYLT